MNDEREAGSAMAKAWLVFRSLATRTGWQLAAVALLGASLAAELALYAVATLTSSDRAAWDHLLPAHIVRDRHVWPASVSAALVALAALQAVLLLFVAHVPERAGRFVALAAVCVAVPMSIAAVRAPYVTSNDAYAYIAYAKLPTLTAAYAPPATALPGSFAVVHAIWKLPLVPAVYGPFDLAVYRSAVGPQPSLAAALLAVRLVGLASVAAFAFLAFALTRSSAFVALVVLNPGLYEQFVVNGHNDLLAMDTILLGVFVARRNAWVGTIVAAASGLVKINLAAIAPAFVPSRFAWPGRVALYLSGIIFALAASAFFGGKPYAAAVLQIAHEFAPGHESVRGIVGSLTHLGLALFGIATVALAAIGAAVPWSFAWSLSGLAAALYPGYLVWGAPAAFRDPFGARLFLAVLPLPSVTYDFAFPGSGDVTRVILLVAMLYETIAILRSRATGTTRRARSIPP